MNFVTMTITDSAGVLWAIAQGLRLKVPPQLGERVRAHAGKRMVLGVRPEALHPANGSDQPDYSFATEVDVVEPLGNEILIDVKIGANPMVARVPPTSRLRMHERVRLSLDPERLHFFDSKTEQAIE